jgi:hypothetical protein
MIHARAPQQACPGSTVQQEHLLLRTPAVKARLTRVWGGGYNDGDQEQRAARAVAFRAARSRTCESFRLPHDPPGTCRPPGTRDSEIQEAPRSDS